MANPRQRRKAKSGTNKLSQSKASRKNKHKVVIKGAAVLAENWDKKQTVRQNYARLGLLPTLNPRQAGGLEPIEQTPFATDAREDATLSDLEDDIDRIVEDQGPIPSTSRLTDDHPKPLAKGQGRIIRDEAGNIIKIVLGGDEGEIEEEVKEIERDDDEEEDDEDESDEESDAALVSGDGTPWGEPMASWSDEEGGDNSEKPSASSRQGLALGASKARSAPQNHVISDLEALAVRKYKVERFTSALENDWLLSLVEKYDDDYEKMARDRKANPWQKTKGEISRAVTKAGGHSKLKAKLAQLRP